MFLLALEICPDELPEKESAEQGIGFSVRNQCSLCGVRHLSNFSVNAERATPPTMAAGSWQGWQSWGASSRSRDEGKWDEKCQEVENGINDFTTVERSKGILMSKLEVVLSQSIKNQRGKKMKKR